MPGNECFCKQVVILRIVFFRCAEQVPVFYHLFFGKVVQVLNGQVCRAVASFRIDQVVHESRIPYHATVRDTLPVERPHQFLQTKTAFVRFVGR